MPSVKEIYPLIDKAKMLVQERGYNTKYLEAMYEPETNEIALRYTAFSNMEKCHAVDIIHLDEASTSQLLVDILAEQMISLITRVEDAIKEKKMDPETAIHVLKNLQDWLYFSGMNGGTKLQREAIDIGIAAIKEVTG